MIVYTDNYDEYLQSAHWKEISHETKDLANGKCEICGKDADFGNAHHTSYDHLGAEWAGSETVWLCKQCHETMHRIIKLINFTEFDELENRASRLLSIIERDREVRTERLVYRIAKNMNIDPERSTRAFNIIRKTLYTFSGKKTSPKGDYANTAHRIRRGKKNYKGVDTKDDLKRKIKSDKHKGIEAAVEIINYYMEENEHGIH